jgi:hypothetical protein
MIIANDLKNVGHETRIKSDVDMGRSATLGGHSLRRDDTVSLKFSQ